MPTARKTIKVKNRRKAISVDLHCHIHTDAADAIAEQSATNASPIARYGNPRTDAQQKNCMRICTISSTSKASKSERMWAATRLPI